MIIDISSVIATLQKSLFHLCSIFHIRSVVNEPEVEHICIKFSGFSLWGPAVMELAIVVSESNEDRGIWEVLSEQLLCHGMSFQEERVVHFDLSS